MRSRCNDLPHAASNTACERILRLFHPLRGAEIRFLFARLRRRPPQLARTCKNLWDARHQSGGRSAPHPEWMHRRIDLFSAPAASAPKNRASGRLSP